MEETTETVEPLAETEDVIYIKDTMVGSEKAYSFLVSNDNGEILLINSPRRGWEYPGGMVEPGETFQDALIRELEDKSRREKKDEVSRGNMLEFRKNSVE
jgi:8-oxo-dGTP pyrophosphatase MutT (NUDIX family)